MPKLAFSNIYHNNVISGQFIVGATTSRASIASKHTYDGQATVRSNKLGRACVPICNKSLNPRVVASAHRSPLRSNNALVATYNSDNR